MNERMKQLCEQSKAWANQCTKDFTGDEPVDWMDYYTEKVAELIVRECIEQIYPQWIKDHSHVDPANLADAVMRVKEHLGVKE